MNALALGDLQLAVFFCFFIFYFFLLPGPVEKCSQPRVWEKEETQKSGAARAERTRPGLGLGHWSGL